MVRYFADCANVAIVLQKATYSYLHEVHHTVQVAKHRHVVLFTIVVITGHQRDLVGYNSHTLSASHHACMGNAG